MCTRLQQMVEAEAHGIREQLQHVPRFEHKRGVRWDQHQGRQQDAVDNILDLAMQHKLLDRAIACCSTYIRP